MQKTKYKILNTKYLELRNVCFWNPLGARRRERGEFSVENIAEGGENRHLSIHSKIKCHNGGTVITIEGPRFSTRAESHMFRQWGADVINMSTVPEVVLANELGISYQSIAMSTDYDCWKEDEKPVTFEMVMERMKDNAERVKKLLVATVLLF
jgi:purine nucleoside phosphorylase